MNARGLLDGYWRSLKPREVEEPIDVWVHRPLAYLLALTLRPTPVSPNWVTGMSIVAGIAASCAMFMAFPRHMPIAGLCIFLSAVFDCADGQLARMRGTSSILGRMLDGAADGVVSIAIVVAGSYVVLQQHWEPPLARAIFVPLVVITAITGSYHTGSYDHYKNLYLRLCHPTYREGEDIETAEARRKKLEQQRQPLVVRIAWPVYVSYIRTHNRFGRWFDPYTTRRLDRLPPYQAERAAIYRRHAEPLMRWWRLLFGFGSLVFGFAVATAFDVLDWYVLIRGIGLNLLYFGYMLPRQRSASRRAFEEMQLLAR